MSGKKKHKIGVIGAGAWGTAISKLLTEKEYHVELWSYEEEVASDINQNKINSKYLPSVILPPGIIASPDLLQVVKKKEYLFLSVPSPYIIDIVKKILHIENIREGETLIGVLTKGFVTTNRGTRLIIETLENYLPGFYKGNLVYISGPSHAEEVARKKLTGLISASLNGKNAIQFRKILTSRNLIVFSSLDVVGVQVCAALKNVIAIGFGILDALKEHSAMFGDNTESLLLAAGLNEIQRLGLSMGSTHPETFTSIAGVGDLDVTCRSIYGRNRRFGHEIILNKRLEGLKSIDEVIQNIPRFGYLPEGIHAAKRVYELSQQYHLKLPISEGVYRILNCDVEPIKEVELILSGILKSREI
jgi:glycerol-3-phosphate dehydrogenase (NAD(P)+)